MFKEVFDMLDEDERRSVLHSAIMVMLEEGRSDDEITKELGLTDQELKQHMWQMSNIIRTRINRINPL